MMFVPLLLRCSKPNGSLLRRFYIKRKYPVQPDDVLPELIPEVDYVSGKGATQMYVWGLVEHGGLGIQRQMKKGKCPSRIPRFLHRPNRLSFAEKHKVTDIACGYGFTVFSVHSKTHKLFGTGVNMDSQLGYQAQLVDAPMSLLLAPTVIELPVSGSSRISSLAAGRSHLLVLVENNEQGSGGKVFSLGNNAYGQCGRQIIEQENYSGSRKIHCIEDLCGSPIKYISAGQDHSIFINTEGKVFACGWSADGQTGQGHYANEAAPSQVKGDIEGEQILKVAASADCNLAINAKGDLFGWGNSEYGQLLCNKSTQLHTPQHIKIPEVGKVVDVAAGGSFCAVLNSNGEVWVWGFGLLGLGPEVTYTSRPQQIPPTLLGYNSFARPGYCITSLKAGLFHLAAVSCHGDLYTWGRNKESCLGLGHSQDQPFPLRVSIGARVMKAACGVDHMAVLCRPFS